MVMMVTIMTIMQSHIFLIETEPNPSYATGGSLHSDGLEVWLQIKTSIDYKLRGSGGGGGGGGV